jgi:anti-sigma regulatory factor (Ser/Thr protein kinase)
VTNALRHGRMGPDDEVELQATLHERDVHIAIRQPTSTRVVAELAQPAASAATRGFGLLMVERLASNWGVEPDPPGCVWFELPLPPGSADPAAPSQHEDTDT